MMADRKKQNEERDYCPSFLLSDIMKILKIGYQENKYVLVLGDKASGKSSLIAKLKKEKQKKCSDLECYRIDVVNEIQHDFLTFWILHDDGSRHKRVLQCVLREEKFPHTLVMLTISMDKPLTWMEQLQHWMKILTEHIAGLQIAPEEMQHLQARLATVWQNYCRSTTDAPKPGASTKHLGLCNAPPLPKGVLTNNLGLDLVVVVTKMDYMTTLEQQFDFRREDFDFMQQCVRRFCLMYGASLIYTSAMEDKNCALLLNYLRHRIYGLPFRTSAVVEKDALLIPEGWDSMDKTGNQNTAVTKTCKCLSKKKKKKKLPGPKSVAAPSTAAEGTEVGDPQSGSSSLSTLTVQSSVGGSADMSSTNDQTSMRKKEACEH